MVKPVSTVLAKGHTREFLQKLKEFRVHSSDADRVVESYFSCLNSPLSLSCLILFRHGEFDQLVQKEVDPRQYIDADSFRRDFAAISFLRKNEFLQTSFNKERTALDSFQASELSCGLTNKRLKSYLRGGQTTCPDEWLLTATIRKIDMILGRFSVDRMIDNAKWGPGSTLSVTGSDTSAVTKFDVDRDITSAAHALFGEVCSLAYPNWDAWKAPRFVESNKVLTVPKNAKTHRTIAVEPGLNLWLQLGVGACMRQRLRYAGFNLDSDLKNQRGAYLGSLDDTIATVDFKAASDSISLELVRLLVPHEWFVILDAVRSKQYKLKGQSRSSWSEKFSTMGNGFTFELESLIFVALALAICSKHGLDDSAVCIFGDDLVIPSACIPDLLTMCEFFGFTVNQTKSYWSGPFRESCGSYFFGGEDVKPIFHKGRIQRVQEVFKLANSITRLASRWGGGICRHRDFSRVWSLLVHLLPELLRLKGPVQSGDGAIHVDFDEVSAPPARNGWEGFHYTFLVNEPLYRTGDSRGLLLARLFGSSKTDIAFGNKVFFRQRTRPKLKRYGFVRQWCALGPWQ